MKGAEQLRAHAARLPELVWEEKHPQDFVSAADLAAEEAVRAVIAARHPDAVIVGEEGSPDEAVAGPGLRFVVDPLDGTTNFLHGFPWYAVSIGVLREGALVAGVVLNAATGEMFTATAGGGARRNGQPIRVSAVKEPLRALVGTGFPFKRVEEIEPYVRVLPRLMRQVSGLRRPGAAALDLADVACGRFDAFFEWRLSAWDVAAGILLVREAGGLVTDFEGKDVEVVHGPVVAGNPTMHSWLLGQLGA